MIDNIDLNGLSTFTSCMNLAISNMPKMLGASEEEREDEKYYDLAHG